MADHPKRPLPSNHDTLPSPKRPKQQPPPPSIPTNHASLRILCNASHIGGFIGKSGSSIKQLQLDTGSKIRVDDPLHPGSDHRVILIIAPSVPFKTVKLRKCPDDVKEEEYVDQVSSLQETALRVFEKVLEVSGETDTTTFRVLIDGSQAGVVIGRRGKIVERLRSYSGAKIRVLSGDQLPPYVSPPDEIIEIVGDLLAVKKGLLGVCGRLQHCPQEDKSSNKESKPVESTSHPTLLDFRVDPPLQRTPLCMATTFLNSATVARPLPLEVDRHASTESKPNEQELVFKILCYNERVGGIIGRGGSIIRALQEETGANINIGPSVADCDERLVTVTSKEDVDTRYSPAQRAVIMVFSRSAEATTEKGLDTGSNKVSPISARLLIPSSQVGCLLGKGGTIVSEMRKATGANIRILKGEQVPKCATEGDQVVEITGPFVKIQDALYQVTSRLRSNLFPNSMTSVSESQTNTSLALDASRHERVGDIPIGVRPSSATYQSIDRLSTMRQSLDSLYNHERLDHSLGSRTSEFALDASYHGRVRDLPIGVHHFSATSQSIDGLSAMRQGLDSLYYHQRLDHSPLAEPRTSEVAFDASRHGRVRDLPIGMHHSSQSIDGLSTTRQGLDFLYNSQRLDHSPLAGPQTFELPLDASRHGRVRDLPIGVHHSFATSQSIDGLSTQGQGFDSLYNRQRLDHLPLSGPRTSEVPQDASLRGRVRDLPTGVHHPFATSQSIDGQSTMRQGVESLYNSQRLDHLPLEAISVNSRSFVNLGRGAAANGGAEFGSANRPAIVTNTTVEILVPEDAINSAYGENGRNLMRIRQISGAKVEVREGPSGTRDRTVLISGTPDETHAAQSLLHAFILTGSS